MKRHGLTFASVLLYLTILYPMRNEDLQIKQQKLEEVKSILKSKFFGIDEVVDQLIEGVRSWYFFPEFQLRPTVINLWGMTGVGKSELVRNLVDLLDFQNDFFMFDCGELGAKSFGSVRSVLVSLNDQNPIRPQVLFFDEIQLIRNIAEDGDEINNQESRTVWQLLDTGKITIQNEWYYRNDFIHEYFKEVSFFISKGLKIENGTVSPTDVSFLSNRFPEKYENLSPSEWEAFIQSPQNRFVANKDELKFLFEASSFQFGTKAELELEIRGMNDQAYLAFIRSLIDRSVKPQYMDLTQSLIFIAGNLDEVFTFSKNQSPDISPDIFHANSKKITLQDVKKALLKRFRAEQIARFGNNHIIYPALNSAAFHQIIEFELEQIQKQTQARTLIIPYFTQELKNWIFMEGVIPTQGVRPLKSSIRNSIEDQIPQFLVDAVQIAPVPEEMFVDYADGFLEVLFCKRGKEVGRQKYKATERQNVHRISRKDDLQALTAVHEAGHAVVHMALRSEIPKMILSVTAESGTHGLVAMEASEIMTPEIMQKRTAVLMAGFLAEKMIFGMGKVSSGSTGDIDQATSLVITQIKESGFGGELIRVASCREEFSDSFHMVEESESLAREILKNSQEESTRVLKKEKVLLLKIAEILADQTSLSSEELEVLARAHGTAELVAGLDAKKPSYRELLIAQARQCSLTKLEEHVQN